MYFPGTRAYRSAWQETIAAAEQFNEPGRFTAFIGYEWTSNTGGNNLHRNVIFRDNGDKASQVEPFTVYPPFGSDNPVELWKWMDAYEKKTGGSVLAIAHNGNLSNGTMFPVVEAFGKRSTATMPSSARSGSGSTRPPRPRATGESHPFLSPNDEFADFEMLGQGQPRRQRREEARRCSNSSMPARRCKNGLKLEQTARHQSLQVRPGQQQRCAHRPHRHGGGQLLRQDRRRRSRARIA